MMGPTHATFGAAVGLVTAPMFGATTTTETFTFTAVCAGAALLPDLDSPSSTVARSFGPVTHILSKLVSKLAWAFYKVTSSPRDSDRNGGHRLLTHTALFVVIAGLGFAALAGWGGKPAVIGILFFFTGLAIRGVLADWAKEQGWLAVTLVSAGAAWLAYENIPAGGQAWLGIAVALGVFSHDVTDGVTKDGICLLAPFVPIKGKRWYELALPGPLRMKAGGTLEYALVLPVATAATIILAVNQFEAGHNMLQAIIG